MQEIRMLQEKIKNFTGQTGFIQLFSFWQTLIEFQPEMFDFEKKNDLNFSEFEDYSSIETMNLIA